METCLQLILSLVIQSPNLPPTAPPILRSVVAHNYPQAEILKLGKRIDTAYGPKVVVKVVHDVKEKKTYLIDTNKYRFHVEFIEDILKKRFNSETFNRKNYTGPLDSRDYVLSSLIFDVTSAGLDQNALLELWSGDTLDGPGISFMKSTLTTLIPAFALTYHPLSNEQEQIARQHLPGEYVLTSEIIGNRSYLALNAGVAYGYLRFVKAGEDPALSHTDIPVYEQAPNDLGLVGAVITQEPQTPLSHINVKSMNRGTANMYLKDAFETLKAYQNKPIKLEVKGDTYLITVLDPAIADAQIIDYWKDKRPKPVPAPKYILDPKYASRFVDVSGFFGTLPNREAHRNLVQTVGAKAANLGLLSTIVNGYDIPDVHVPEALGVPFNFYEEFITTPQKGLIENNPEVETTIAAQTKEILQKHGMLEKNKIVPIATIRTALQEIKALYARGKVPDSLMSAFKKAIMEDISSPIHISKQARIRLRSSTNSEDMEGFTGAGLYDSAGISFYKKHEDGSFDRSQPKEWKKIQKDLEEEILSTIFPCVWNERAYLERDWFGVTGLNHMEIKVGIAVHGGFPFMGFDHELGEIANGVSISYNPVNPSESYKFLINGQHFDLAVTNPPLPEELKERGEDPTQAYATEEILASPFSADDAGMTDPTSWMRVPIETLRKSSVLKGKPVFKESNSPNGPHELRNLVRAISSIRYLMAQVYGRNPETFYIDMEWKIYGPDRKLYIKQARPFEPPVK